jgi:hypothetical protein
MEQKVKGVLIAIALWTGLIATGIGNARADYVTMDVDSSVQSGTVVCASVQQCYIKVLQMEERGATNYCNSVIIKRNGKIVWAKNYWQKPNFR